MLQKKKTIEESHNTNQFIDNRKKKITKKINNEQNTRANYFMNIAYFMRVVIAHFAKELTSHTGM